MTRIAAVAAAVLAATSIAVAHELEETSATLVVRDGGHVQVRLQVPYEDVLRKAIMPAATREDFRRVAAAMPPAEFGRAFAQVEEVMTGQTALLVNGRTVALAHWSKPSAAQVQDEIRSIFMASLVDATAHTHVARLSVTAEGRAAGEVKTVQIKLPAVLGPYLVTAYRPRETWVKEGAASPVVNLATSDRM